MEHRGMWLYYLLAQLHRPRGERGATAVEYALIGALCVLAFSGAVWAFKTALGLYFAGQQETVDGWVPSG